MCAINPKHECHFTLDVFTSEDLPLEEFTRLVMEAALAAEMELNKTCKLRWHINEKK